MADEKYEVAICLFQHDLRLEDNETFHKASQSKHVIPLYVFDPRHLGKTKHFKMPKVNCHKLEFILASVQDLRSQLKALGSDLIIKQGKTEDVIADVLKTLNPSSDVAVYMEKEVLCSDEDMEENIEKNCGITVLPVWGKTLYHLDDLAFEPEDMPDKHTDFSKAVKDTCKVRSCFDKPAKLNPLPPGLDRGVLPTLESLGVQAVDKDARSSFKFSGGETVALEHLQKLLWGSKDDTSCLDALKTKLSPWFSHGCISPRKVYWALKTYEKEQKANHSTEKMMTELIWRDYFQFMCLKFKDKMFLPYGIKGGDITWKNNMDHFKAWKNGQTGVPYIDANMRELLATGFMSNKGRENVASFLTRDLQLDWRLGAEWFEAKLIDHETCNNYGNWQCSAGIGPDPEVGKWTNVVEEAQHYDANGDYVRLWVPELQGLKSKSVHTVWSEGVDKLKSAHVELGKTYPDPVIKLDEWLH